MEVRIIEGKRMSIVGSVSTGATVGDIDIEKLWSEFLTHLDAIEHRVEGTTYEIHQWDETVGKHSCMTGVEVTKIDDVPLHLLLKRLPDCRYAVFTHHFSDGGYREAYRRIDEWLESSQYVMANDFDIQCYDERFQGPEHPESVVELRIPIRAR